MCVLVSMVVRGLVGQVTMVSGMERRTANLLLVGACWAPCQAQMVSAITTLMWLWGDMRAWARVVYVYDTTVSLGHAPASTLKETCGPRTESLASSALAFATTDRQQRLHSS